MIRLFFTLLLLTAGTLLWSQTNYDRASYKKENTAPNKVIRLRIDQGKVFLNDRSIPVTELPTSLQNISPEIYYETNVAGVSEFTFNLGNRYFLVQNGKLTEVATEAQGNDPGYNSKSATEAYYSQLKRESPNLFYGLSREGALLEEIRTLLIDYSVAQGKQREKIKEEIRLVLGQLYDINERNKEMEIEELEDMIQAAKAEVQYRKAHKSDIIDNSLNNLLKE
ncbi:MAG: hypothetical protein KA239_10900 [Bacteroidia bacterium]|nr:hypothetical protein [Bacteroidia bacterium]